MTEIERLVDQLKRAYEGDAWYGIGLLEVLKEVTSEIAFQTPKEIDRSIAVSLLHMIAWMEFTIKGIEGNPIKVTEEKDWPVISDKSPESWDTILKQYQTMHDNLRETISKVPEDKLMEMVPEKPFNKYFLIQGVIQHNVYHTAQIALIRNILLMKK